MPLTRAQIEDRWLDAVHAGDINLVKAGLNRDKIDPTIWNNEALRIACCNNRPEIAKLLLSYPQVNYPKSRIPPTFYLNNHILQCALTNRLIDILRLIIVDPRVNPAVTPERAKILPNIDLLPIILANEDVTGVLRYVHEDTFLASVNHAADKVIIRQTAKNLAGIQALEGHNLMIPNIARTLANYTGPSNRTKTITNRLYKLKGNYFGPKKEKSRKTIKTRKTRKIAV